MRKVGTGAAVAAAFAIVSLGLVPNIVRACGVGTQFELNAVSGPPGSQVSATGNGFAPGPVSIRWESPAGTTLATTSGTYFAGVPLVIPANAAPGLHYVDAWDGVGSNYVTTTFTVTAPDNPPPATPAPAADSTSSGSAGAPSSPAAASATSSAGAPTSTAPDAATTPSHAAGSDFAGAASDAPASSADSTMSNANSPESVRSDAAAASPAISNSFEDPSAGFSRLNRPHPATASVADPSNGLGGMWAGLLAAGVAASLLAGAGVMARRRRVRVR